MAWKKYSQGLFFNQKRLYKCHHQYIVIHEQLHSTYHAPASHFRRDLIESYLSYAKSEDHVSELHVRMFSLLIEEMFGNSERHDTKLLPIWMRLMIYTPPERISWILDWIF